MKKKFGNERISKKLPFFGQTSNEMKKISKWRQNISPSAVFYENFVVKNDNVWYYNVIVITFTFSRDPLYVSAQIIKKGESELR